MKRKYLGNERERRNAASKEYYKRNREKILEKQRKKYYDDKDYRNKERERSKQRWQKIKTTPELKRKYDAQHRSYYIRKGKLKQKERRDKIKKNLVMKLGGKCMICGYDKNLACLSFHHINSETKETQLEWLRKDFDVSKVKLLCINCHFSLHHPEYNNWKS